MPADRIRPTRYHPRSEVIALQYDGTIYGARYTAIANMLREAFGADPRDMRGCLGVDMHASGAPAVVYTSADGSAHHRSLLRAGDYVLVHRLDGAAFAVTVLAEQVFDVAYVAVG